MAISDNYVPLKELGNGTTTEFSDNWAVLSASFLRVFLEDVTTGVQVLQIEGSDYNLTFDSSGFVVTFLTAPTSADFVVISRDVAIDQTVPYTTSKGFQGSVQEGSFDKAAAISQDQQDDIDRSLGFPIGSSAIGSLPTPVDDLFLGWNSTTGAIKNSVKTITEVENAVDTVASLVAGSGVLVSANDTTVGFLNGKLVAGVGVSFVENNDGANETLTINTNTPDGSVTNTKLADMAQSTIKGRIAGSGTGAPVDLTPTQIRTIADVYSTSEVDALVDAKTGITLGAPVATTSGTAFDFTSIPAGTKRITVNFDGVSLSGTDSILVQLGDAGGIEVSGYVSSSIRVDGTPNTVSSTAGFIIRALDASILHSGSLVINLLDASTFTWEAIGLFDVTAAAVVTISAGGKSLSAELDKVRVTRTGTNTFDAGKLNISFE